MFLREMTGRDLILKARQFGFTSLILALFVIDSLELPNTRSVIMAHDKESTQRLLRRARMYINRFYSDDHFVPVNLNLENKNEIVIEETNSTIYIGAAGSRTFGRGDTIHNLLLSELAQYKDPDKIFTGVMQAVPEGGRVIAETTANGYNFYRRLWYESKSGQSDFKCHFFPWFLHDEYEVIGDLPDGTKDEEEIDLQKQFHEITNSKLLWRRRKKKDFVSNPDLFNQEYPATDHEAFVFSGHTVFNSVAVEELLKQAKPPIFKGNVDVNGQLSSDPKGFLWLWELCKPTEAYTIGGDTAEGVDKNDFAAGVIMKRSDAKVIGVWHGHIDPDQFGAHLVGLGRYFNNAIIGCEVNGPGIATNIKMRDLGYQNIYKRITYDQTTQKETANLGWRTDVKSKPMMINDLKALIREGQIPILDERILLEILAYQEIEPSGISERRKMGAPPGEHDDLVIATSIAYQMIKYTAAPLPNIEADRVPTNYLERAEPN